MLTGSKHYATNKRLSKAHLNIIRQYRILVKPNPLAVYILLQINMFKPTGPQSDFSPFTADPLIFAAI